MSTGNINLSLFLNELFETLNTDSIRAKDTIKRKYPSLNDKEAAEICALIQAASKEKKDNSVSLAVTAPPSFSIKAKSTKNTVESMLTGAKKSILLTGYSLSEYFDDLVDVIIQKSQSGVFVEFYINNIVAQGNIDKLKRYKGHFLKLYNYSPSEDAMSALHAKVISVDNRETLITSANLSYHGQEGNIELGVIINSDKVARQVKDIFTKLVFKKVFTAID